MLECLVQARRLNDHGRLCTAAVVLRVVLGEAEEVSVALDRAKGIIPGVLDHSGIEGQAHERGQPPSRQIPQRQMAERVAA